MSNDHTVTALACFTNTLFPLVCGCLCCLLALLAFLCCCLALLLSKLRACSPNHTLLSSFVYDAVGKSKPRSIHMVMKQTKKRCVFLFVGIAHQALQVAGCPSGATSVTLAPSVEQRPRRRVDCSIPIPLSRLERRRSRRSASTGDSGGATRQGLSEADSSG